MGNTAVTATTTANDESSSEAEVTLESMSTEPEGEPQEFHMIELTE